MRLILITDIEKQIGKDKTEAYCYDPDQTTNEVLTLLLKSSKIYIKTLCARYDQEFDETDEAINEAVLQYAIGEVFDFSSDEISGEFPKKKAIEMINNLFAISDETTNINEEAVVTVVQCQGRRRVEDIDKWIDDE